MFSELHILLLKFFIIGIIIKIIFTGYVLICKPHWFKKLTRKFLPQTINLICDQSGEIVPWMTRPAIDFLKNNIKSEYEVCEFGCGSSTLFFAKRVKKVISVETREEWLEMVKNMTKKTNKKNVEIKLIKDGLSNSDYENFAKNQHQKFDLIVIDSIKRFESAKNSIEALKSGGSIILDDSERDNYKKIFNFFAEKNFVRHDFVGISPGQMKEKNTTIFQSPQRHS